MLAAALTASLACASIRVLDNPAFGGVAPIQFNLDSAEVAGY
jgi:hypothetical protein